MTPDALADVFDLARVRGAVMAHVRANAPWGLQLPRAEGATFHAVTAGACWLRMPGRAPRELRVGDVVLLPTGTAHVIASEPRGPTREWSRVAKAQARNSAGEIALAGRGRATHLICAAYDYDRAVAHPLLSLLPPMLVVSASESDAAQSTLQLLHRELTDPSAGSGTIVDRLIDVLFVHVIRAWLARQQDPGQSRWRLELAARRLRETDETVGAIAHHVGYASEFAFSRAFSRLRGEPPGRYRSRVRREQSGAWGE